MEKRKNIEHDEFRCKLKEEWTLLWRERIDDKVKAEGIAVRDYPLLFMDRGLVIFASRDAKAPNFSEIVEYWGSQGMIYVPNPIVGGWGKFIRTELKKLLHSRAKKFNEDELKIKVEKQQLKKSGRGWLHLE